MKIAICDKDRAFSEGLKKLIYRYAAARRFEAVADIFPSGEALLESRSSYSLIFLEYELTGINGLQTAWALRKKGIPSQIIFISNNTDFVLESFKVNPYRFLLKTAGEDELSSALDDFFIKYGNDYPLWIKNRDETAFVNSDDIFYIEADNKHCTIHLEKSALNCNKTMARVFEVLPKNTFSKINRAYIVNLRHIKSYSAELVTLSNGKTVHPSRNYYKSFKEEYRTFLHPTEL